MTVDPSIHHVSVPIRVPLAESFPTPAQAAALPETMRVVSFSNAKLRTLYPSVYGSMSDSDINMQRGQAFLDRWATHPDRKALEQWTTFCTTCGVVMLAEKIPATTLACCNGHRLTIPR